MALENDIVRHLLRIGYDDLPATTVAATKRSILDTIGVMLAATGLSNDALQVAEFAADAGGKPESTVVGLGHRLPAVLAALVNGALAHPLDFDDTHDKAACHPTAVTLPTALALAERTGGTSGRDFIAAIAVATDFVCRMGLSLDVAIPEHNWLTPAVLGYFGAATAGGKVLAFDEATLGHALGIAFAQASGSHQMSKGRASSVRGIRDGFSQQSGTLACLLALRGITGPAGYLDGEAGLFRQYFHGRYDRHRLLTGLGERFEGDAVSLKPWPCCRLSHVYIDAVISLIGEHELSEGDVAEVSVVVDEWARMLCEPIEERTRPTSDISAKYSIPFTIGVALAHGNVELEHFTVEGLADPASLSEAAKVRFVLDPGAFAGRERPGIVHLLTTDGRALNATVVQPYGTPGNPMSDADVRRKFLDCVGHAAHPVQAARALEIIDMCLSLEAVADVRDLARLLR